MELEGAVQIRDHGPFFENNMYKFGTYKRLMIEADEEVRRLKDQLRRAENTKAGYHRQHYKGLGTIVMRSKLRKMKDTK